jgi:hypothetical protein
VESVEWSTQIGRRNSALNTRTRYQNKEERRREEGFRESTG